MMYPFLTIDQTTEITHSEMKETGEVKVYIEKPDEQDGFHYATCWLPSYRWENIFGFTEEELDRVKNIIRSKSLFFMKENIKVKDVTPLEGGKMIVLFSTGEKRLFDTSLLQGSAFVPLKDESIVSHPSIFHGIITWDNGKIDVAPETVYNLSSPYQDNLTI